MQRVKQPSRHQRGRVMIGWMMGCLVGLLSCISSVSPEARADEVSGQVVERTEQKDKLNGATLDQMVNRASEFLKTRQQPNGAFSPEAGPGVTALVTTALLRHGRTVEDPTVAKGLAYLESLRQSSGGIHAPESKYMNYETCLAMMCFVEANRDGRYTQLLKDAERFVKEIQWDGGEQLATNDPGYGGAGYGSHKRPDLSNTAFLIEALHAVGNDADSESIQMALQFVSRCQNLESPHNTTPHAAKVRDGGFYYTAAAGGSSQAGTDANGGLRSYASMTYAGLKSMIYAGVSPDDARIQAALEWIGQHYDLKTNPGMGTSGLFYYYHTFAKAMHTMGKAEFIDEAGQAHNWRAELTAELAGRQRTNGSWVNDDQRWLEANPDLVTGYALLALSYARPAANGSR